MRYSRSNIFFALIAIGALVTNDFSNFGNFSDYENSWKFYFIYTLFFLAEFFIFLEGSRLFNKVAKKMGLKGKMGVFLRLLIICFKIFGVFLFFVVNANFGSFIWEQPEVINFERQRCFTIKDPGVCFNLGRRLRLDGLISDAYLAFDTACNESPNYNYSYCAKAAELFLNNQTDLSSFKEKARIIIEKIYTNSSTGPVPKSFKAQLHFLDGENEKALALQTEAYELLKSYPQTTGEELSKEQIMLLQHYKNLIERFKNSH